MEIMNQPFTGQLGDRLIDFLNSQEFHTLNIVVAFAKNSGVLRIKSSLENFRKHGGIVNAYVGVDLGVTSYEALTNLLFCTDSLSVVHSEKGQTFHTKIYQFLGSKNGVIVVGSHNLTGGGLWTNFESSAHILVEESNPKHVEVLRVLDDYFKQLGSLKDSFMPITEKGDIDKLLQNGYITNEVSQQIRSSKTTTNLENRKPLFGNGVSAKLPSIRISEKEPAVVIPEVPIEQALDSKIEEDETIWFETRKLTGGSRNILDLSMTCLVESGNPKGTAFDLGKPGFMRGAVEFFGVNSSAKKTRKDIILNFDGVDYAGNTILFPSGENANGTWRLQVKGINSSGEKITEAFKAKGEDYYLVEKIITFTKVRDDYYYMSVFPESEAQDFEKASRILARNGTTKNTKRLGLL